MFFSQHYISAVPIREEQRLSEEEELARELKREARIFFPDKKPQDGEMHAKSSKPGLPAPEHKSQLPGKDREGDAAKKKGVSPMQKNRPVILENHDEVCKNDDNLLRNTDRSFSGYDLEAARQEEERIKKNKNVKAVGLSGVINEPGLETEGGGVKSRTQLNLQDLKRGIRLTVVLEKPRGLAPWKEDNF